VSLSRNQRHLPEVRCLSTESDGPIVDALVCLTNAFRSQGFAPSQRFDPGTPSWLCFKPHPSIGFMGLQSFSHRGQPWCLSALSALLPSSAPGHTPNKPVASVADESAWPASRTDHVRHTTGDPDSRALLRPGVRHSARRVNVVQSRCSLDLFPLRGMPTRPLGLTPPLVHLPAATSEKERASGATGCQSGRA